MPKSKISNITGVTRSLRNAKFLSSPGVRLFNCAGVVAAIGLAALPAFLMLAPMFSSMEANAEPQTIGAAATIVPNLSLSAENVSMIMTPTGSGSIFKTGSIDATVSTNNETGYTLYFSDKDDNTSLSHTNLANTAITSTESALTGTNMLANTWGYTLSNPADEGADEVNNTTNLGLIYSPIPTDYTVIKSSDSLTENESSKLTFGVKISNGIPSGTYSDEILISAIINYSSAGYDQSKLWVNKNGTRITTLQEMTPDVCASVPTPTVTATGSNVPEVTLKDTRDNKTYQVKKLADGNCWMTSDLALGSTTEDIVLTSEKSNVATNFTLHKAKTAANQTANSYDTDYTFTGNSTNNNTYLYNWYAATAGSGRAISSGNASQDICPKGWHLPNNDGNASWDRLLNRSDGVYKDIPASKIADGTSILGLHFTGRLSSGSLSDLAGGRYWSRTTNGSADAYGLNFESDNVSPRNNNRKDDGRAVRCVADDKEYLQNWTGCAGLSEGETVALLDRRDGKEYTVTKINHSDSDSLCWMTKNLALGGTTTMALDSSTTNLPSGTTYTLPASSTSGFSSDTTAYVYVHDTYGGYYSHLAATATPTNENPSSGEASKSICPKGWRLPTEAEFVALKSYKGWNNSSAWTSGVFGGQLAGGYYNGSADNQGSNGGYWSSTVDRSTYAYSLYYNSSGTYTSYGNKRAGYSVRCVFGS